MCCVLAAYLLSLICLVHLPVSPSAWNSWSPTGRIFMKSMLLDTTGPWSMALYSRGLTNQRHLLPQFLYFFCPTSVSILWITREYIQIYDCVQTVYELLLLPSNTAVKHFYTNRERCEVLTGYHWGAGLGVTGPIVTLDRTFYSLVFKLEAVAAHSYFHIYSLITIPAGGLY